MMHRDRGEPLEKSKVEMLEIYTISGHGMQVPDNKHINEITTSGTSSEEFSEDLSDIEMEQLSQRISAAEAEESEANRKI